MSSVPCSVCGRSFVPRFAYQTTRTADGAPGHFCSVACRTGPSPSTDVAPEAKCVQCGTAFRVQYALQTVERGGQRRPVCSEACRKAELAADDKRGSGARVIAVLNQKGGTGKTTTSVSVAAELARRGRRVLLIDADPQGSVAVSLGITAPRGLYHVLVCGADPMFVAVPARENLWVVAADRSLLAAEVALAKARDRWRIMAKGFASTTPDFDFVIIDCAPSVSLVGHNALAYAEELIVPVACDYLSLVGVKQVLRTVSQVNETLQHPIRVLGVLPTFFDLRSRIGKQSVDALKAYFEDKVMPPVRVSTAFKEAPSVGRTIFEHAGRNRGVQDYVAVVDWLEATRAGPPAVVAAAEVGSSFGSVLTSEA